MNAPNYFSDDFAIARQRFVEALAPAGFTHEAHAIKAVGPKGEILTIDVGVRRGKSNERALIVSSGLHGVEGYFGSAAQLALLQDGPWLEAAEDRTIVMIHALNPFGFAWQRRWNEDNVDLNRSFFEELSERPQTPPAFHHLKDLLNPATPPKRGERFFLKAVWPILRHGFGELKRSLPVGQYDYPQGIFFGGQEPSATQAIIEKYLPQWLGEARDILHLDFHTGLGKWGTYALLLGSPADAPEIAGLQMRFGADKIEDASGRQFKKIANLSKSDVARAASHRPLTRKGVAYPARGLLSAWVERRLPEANYRMITAEFGTYSNIRVLRALLAENRAHHFGDPAEEHAWTKDELVEMFAPQSADWRASVIADARKIGAQAIAE